MTTDTDKSKAHDSQCEYKSWDGPSCHCDCELRSLSAEITELRQAKVDLVKEIERLELTSRTTYHGLWEAVPLSDLDKNEKFFCVGRPIGTSYKKLGCHECLSLSKKEAEAVAMTLNRLEAMTP